MRVQRVLSPGVAESWTVIGSDLRPVQPVEGYLGWLSRIERAPTTVRAYAHDLRLFWEFVEARGLAWDAVSLEELGEFTAWLRAPAENMIVLEAELVRGHPHSARPAPTGPPTAASSRRRRPPRTIPGVTDESAIAHRYRLLAPHFTDHQLRMWAAVEARSYGKGGIATFARITGIPSSAITRAQQELQINKPAASETDNTRPTQSTN